MKVLEGNRILSKVGKPRKTVNSGSCHEGEYILIYKFSIYHKIKVDSQVMVVVLGVIRRSDFHILLNILHHMSFL